MSVATPAGWTREAHPEGYEQAWREHVSPDTPPPDAFGRGSLRALVARELIGGGPLRWHISVSHADRVPNWTELVEAAHQLRPGVPFCVGIPPRSWWMNVHPNVLHLFETRDEFLIAQWRAESSGHEPT